MSDTETKASAPTHIAYQVRESSEKSYWKPIGAAWLHKDGKGFNVQLDCLPIDGRISLRITSGEK